MEAKKPNPQMTRSRVLIEEIRRLQLRALELMKEAQEIVDERSGVGSGGKTKPRKSKK